MLRRALPSRKPMPKQKKSTLPAATFQPAFQGFTQEGFDFLTSLAKNNNREWFQDNKQVYHRTVRDPFVAFIEALNYRIEGSGLDLRGGKQSVFRIHRDTRFAKDKTPYKTHAGGVLSYSGTKKDSRGILYIQFADDGGFVASGFYQPESKVLGVIRSAIIEHPDDALAITKGLAKRSLPLTATGSLKRMPRGFEDYAKSECADSEVIDLLKMKGHIMRQALSSELWRSAEIIEVVAQFAHDTYPWLAFCRNAIAQLDE